MKSGVIKIFHFHNGSGGGVLSVIRNLLLYKQHDVIENHVIYTINRDTLTEFTLPQLIGTASSQVFYYSPKWNFYYTCRQLAKLLPNNKAIIVAHDWLELGMASNLGLQNPIVQIIHGNYDYYYDLTLRHKDYVDFQIAISDEIKKNLIRIDYTFSDTVKYLRFPVLDLETAEKKYEKIRFAYFVNNLNDQNKQFYFLPLIDSNLIEYGIFVEWHIAGVGTNIDVSLQKWLQGDSNRIKYYGFLGHDDLELVLDQSNAVILPSLNEGIPVSVIEAMKSGLIPFVSYWHGAVSDFIIEGISGFYIDPTSPEKSAKIIADIITKSFQNLPAISRNASSAVKEKYDPTKNTFAYEEVFLDAFKNKKVKKRQRIYGSRLDIDWLPNFITKTLRSSI